MSRIWHQIEKVFHEAAELEPAARPQFLDSACEGNEELRREVESLLARADKPGLLGLAALDVAMPMVSQIRRRSWRLSPGMRLGSYEITGVVGAGGMAEVYSARDTKLHRDVAIKVLPETFARDPERIARLHREAQLLASLNHPRIAAIYGLEEREGICGLALEFVAGETLEERIARGRLPIDEALEYSRQIAEALEAAHAKGVVHRDLKPANIKITHDSMVKVLDFGLAKIFQEEPSKVDLSTADNVILGTAAYMSPEQARGKDVDKRTDIWAWGCLLYEMITGRRAFDGDTTTDVIAKIVAEEPDWTKLPENTPPSVRTVLKRTFQKDPNRRIHDIADARIEIQEGPSERVIMAGKGIAGRRREYLAWGATLVAVVLAVAALYFRPAPVEIPETRLDIVTPANTTPARDLPAAFAISPDSRKLVFRATTGGRAQLWLRRMESEHAEPLEDTDRAGPPFWSPDSQSVGFYGGATTGSLKKIDIAGSRARTLAVTKGFFGGTWSSNGTILFSGGVTSPLFRIPQSGGQPIQVTRLEANQSSQRYPLFLPDGRHFLFLATGTPDVAGIYLGSLDSQHTERLFEADSKPEFAPPNYILFVREQTLFAQRLDMDKLKPIREPFVVAERIALESGVFGMAAFSAAASGALAYRAAVPQTRQWTWVDRSGRQIGTVGEPDSASPAGARVSPDGRTLAFVREMNGNHDIWLLDVIRGSLTRFTTDTANDGSPVWSPHGDRVAFNSSRKKGGGNNDLYQKYVTGETEVPLLETRENLNMLDWSPDGRFILYTFQRPQRVDYDIWAMPTEGDRKPFPVAQTDFQENSGRFSPDSRWVAYQSNESGRYEIYLRPFPGPGRAGLVSWSGGENPKWNRNGREIFYIDPGSRVMTVPLTLRPNGAVDAGKPVPLFTLVPGAGFPDTSTDGQRFLLNMPLEEARPSPITIVLNWAGLRKKN